MKGKKHQTVNSDIGLPTTIKPPEFNQEAPALKNYANPSPA